MPIQKVKTSYKKIKTPIKKVKTLIEEIKNGKGDFIIVIWSNYNKCYYL